jgi:hypothetical protein
MSDFMSILNKPVEDVAKPKPRPVGTYLGAIQGMPAQKMVTVQGEEKPIISFSIKLVMAQGDVDSESLTEHGDVSSWPPYKKDFWVDTPEGEWALRQFLTNTLAIDAEGGKTFGEMLAEAPGKQLNVGLKHRPFVNKQGEAEIATEIGSTAKA